MTEKTTPRVGETRGMDGKCNCSGNVHRRIRVDKQFLYRLTGLTRDGVLYREAILTDEPLDLADFEKQRRVQIDEVELVAASHATPHNCRSKHAVQLVHWRAGGDA